MLNAINEARKRAPFYKSDFLDLEYRVIPATIFIFFANVLPALTFAQDTFNRTENAFGVNEVLLGAALGAIVFALFSVQPLVIVSVTGPVCIFLYTVFDIVNSKTNFFAFNAWIGIWSFILHCLITLFNACKYMQRITRFSGSVFGCFNAIIYMEKGVQLLVKQFEYDELSGYFQIVIALLMLLIGAPLTLLIKFTNLPFWAKKFVTDYTVPLLVVFFTGFSYFPGRIRELSLQRLQVSKSFQPSPASINYGREHGWFIHFWDIKVGYVFLALPFAILLTSLFYFDHNISAIMSQPRTIRLRKPSGLNFDFLLLGVTTLVAGFLGIPAPNGLIPQAPLHVASLQRNDGTILEQRVSNFLQGLATIGLMTSPLLKVLHLVPQGVLAGLFLVMGVTSLMMNELVLRLYELLCVETAIDRRSLFKFILVGGLGVAGEVAITQTIAAIGFPGVLFLTILISYYLPKLFPNDINYLDGRASSL